MSTKADHIEKDLIKEQDPAQRLQLLRNLAFEYSRSNATRGIELCEEAIAIARSLHDKAAEAECLRVRAWCCETLSDYVQAMNYAEKALHLSKEVGDVIPIASCLNLMGVVAHGQSHYSRALEVLLESISLFDSVNDLPGLASAHNNLGMVYQTIARYPDALQSFLSALRINEQRGDEVQAGANIGNVANVYYYLGDTERSFEYDQRALAIARKHGRSYTIAHALESISSNYKLRSDFDAALSALQEALNISIELQEKRYEASIRVKIGSIYESRKNVDAAIDEYRTAIRLSESVQRMDTLCAALLRVATLYASSKKHKKAIVEYEKLLEKCAEWKQPQIESEAHRGLAESLAAVGKHDEAYRHLALSMRIHEEISGKEQQRLMAEMQARFDVERSEREREVLRLTNQHLHESMELRTKELSAMALRLVQKNSVLQKLRKTILQMSAEHPESADWLQSLHSEISSHLRGIDEWDRFEQEFQLMHHDFLKNLSQRYPKLTPTELKVCSMLKMNLSNKEIANLLSVSIRSVESHRYSIRRKMDLALDANLTAVLVGM